MLEPFPSAVVGPMSVLVVAVCDLLLSFLEYRLLTTYDIGAKSGVVVLVVLCLGTPGAPLVSLVLNVF